MNKMDDIAQEILNCFERRESIPVDQFYKPPREREPNHSKAILDIEVMERRSVSRIFDLAGTNLSISYIERAIFPAYDYLRNNALSKETAITYLIDMINKIVSEGVNWNGEYTVITPLSPCSMAGHSFSIGPFAIEARALVETRLSSSLLWSTPKGEFTHYAFVKLTAEAGRAMEIGEEYISQFADMLQYMC